MTVTASLVFPANGATAPVVTPGIRPAQTVTQTPIVLRSAVVRNPAKTTRPTSRRRTELMATPAGQQMARTARESLGAALQSHDLAPLAALRLSRGLSQKELCDASGLPQPHLSRLENGKVTNPDAGTLVALSKGLGASLDEVLAAIRQGVRT